MRKLALFGASGHGKVVADAAMASGYEMVVFFDDAFPDKESNGVWPVEGDANMLFSRLGEFNGVLVSIGNCAIRFAMHKRLTEAGAIVPTIVHPNAVVGRSVSIGAGSVLLAGAVINTHSSIGAACIINTGATVDHDARLEDGVHICPGAHLAGDVRVGKCSWVGIGAVVRQSLSIGKSVTVGAGAVVIDSVPDGLTIVGNPARPLKLKSV